MIFVLILNTTLLKIVRLYLIASMIDYSFASFQKYDSFFESYQPPLLRLPDALLTLCRWDGMYWPKNFIDGYSYFLWSLHSFGLSIHTVSLFPANYSLTQLPDALAT